MLKGKLISWYEAEPYAFGFIELEKSGQRLVVQRAILEEGGFADPTTGTEMWVRTRQRTDGSWRIANVQKSKRFRRRRRDAEDGRPWRE